MLDYAYSRLPLTPSIAAEHIVEFLSAAARPVRRSDIIDYVEKKHVSAGGWLDSVNIVSTIKKAINRLIDEGKAKRQITGWYSSADLPETPPSSTLQLICPVVEPDDDLLIPEIEIGFGSEVVYVYFNDAERRLAAFENRVVWPCKVGFTSRSITVRILGQSPFTSMARLPVVGLVIHTDDGQGLERVLHLALEAAGAWIDEGAGSEWFNTSPSKISDWFSAYQTSLAHLRGDENV